MTEITTEALDEVRENYLRQLAEAGDRYIRAEEELERARVARLDLMCEIAGTKLLTNEQVYIAARAARTTLYDELQLRRDAAIAKSRGATS